MELWYLLSVVHKRVCRSTSGIIPSLLVQQTRSAQLEGVLAGRRLSDAAVRLIGHITRLARPFVCPSPVCRVRARNSKTKKRRKIKIGIQCAAKKVSPKVSCHFLSNHLEFLCEILHVYYLFMYT